MTRLIIMILITFAYMGCQSREEKTANQEINQPADSTQAAEKEEEHETAKNEELELNKGSKWKLDDKTRENIGLIRQLIKDSAGSTSIILQLRQQTNKLVSDCRMEGKAHDALHQWLSEFLEDLKKADSTQEAKQETAIARLKKDIEEFDHFFE